MFVESDERQQTPILPLEILAQIFEYLDDMNDLKNMTLVCKHWLRATQVLNKVLKSYKLTFRFITIDSTKQASLFTNSNRMFSNIYFENVKFSSIDPQFWGRWSDYITDVTFDYKYRTSGLPGGNFVKFLKYTPRIKTLSLICSMGLFDTYFEELTTQDKEIISANLKNVHELQLYLGDECLANLKFGTFLEQMTNLKNIDFDVHSKRTPISYQARHELFNFLRKYGSKIKGLHIDDCSRPLNQLMIGEIFTVEGMKLKALDIIINAAATKAFNDFLSIQSDLEYLTVSGPFSVTSTLPQMKKLKEISMSNGPALDGFKAFNNVEKLESLGIAGLEFYNEDGLDETFKMNENLKLKELYLIDATIDFGWRFVKRICECYKNIRLLNLDGALIDDVSLPYLFKLKKLQELKLSRTQISDRGFSGYVGRRKVKTPNGSAIVIERPSASISSLTELEVLNIDFCKRLGSHSFYRMKLPKLKHFSAAGTHINGIHMQSLQSNCPKIESLNLSHCKHLRENDILAVMTIKGLDTLELESCPYIDELCMEHIMSSPRLQTLNISKCTFDVKLVAQEMFSRMESLRRIILSKTRLYRCDYVES